MDIALADPQQLLGPLGLLWSNVFTLRSDFLLAYIGTLWMLRSWRRGGWDAAVHAWFVTSASIALIIFVVLGLRVHLEHGAVAVLLGAGVAAVGWVCSGALTWPGRLITRGAKIVAGAAGRVRRRSARARIPDRLPQDWRAPKP